MNKIRFDLQILADLIKPNAKVLDIGCGSGELLYYLKKNKNIDGKGMEISHNAVSNALVRGLSVIQGNAEQDLAIYSDNSFDYAVLSQTIQATHNPPKILLEMLRIANFAIVSLPNFAHLQNRLEILFRGRMPVNKSIPYQWYETPNIHFCSIIDFEKLCDDLDLIIVKKIFLTNNHRLIGFFGKELLANLLARYGLFLITKKEFLLSGQEEFAFKNNIRIPYSKAIPSLMQKKVD